MRSGICGGNSMLVGWHGGQPRGIGANDWFANRYGLAPEKTPTAAEPAGDTIWIAERGAGKAVSIPMPK
jgi:hypothetical protein